DGALLGPRERAFLTASGRALRRQRTVRRLAVLAPFLVLALAFGISRWIAYRQLRRYVAQQLEGGRLASERAHGLDQGAARLRAGALDVFDGRVVPKDRDSWTVAGERWK